VTRALLIFFGFFGLVTPGLAAADQPKLTEHTLIVPVEPESPRKVTQLWTIDSQLFLESKDAPTVARKAARAPEPAPQLQLKQK
jgi:hypothetical protein